MAACSHREQRVGLVKPIRAFLAECVFDGFVYLWVVLRVAGGDAETAAVCRNLGGPGDYEAVTAQRRNSGVQGEIEVVTVPDGVDEGLGDHRAAVEELADEGTTAGDLPCPGRQHAV